MNLTQWNSFYASVETKAKAGAKKLDYQKLYIEHWAHDSVNKYFSGFSLSNKPIMELLKKNDFQSKWEKLGYNLSKYGTGYGLVILKNEKEFFIETVRIHSAKYKFGKLIDLYMYTDDTLELPGNNNDEKNVVSIEARFYIKDKKVYKEEGYFVINDNKDKIWNVKGETLDYNTEVIPVIPFHNNSLRTPDILKEAKPLISQLDAMMDGVPVELAKNKVIFMFNEYMNSTNGETQFEKDIINENKSSMATSDPDQPVGNSVVPFNMGGQSVSSLEKTIGFIDNRVREMCNLFRDHGSDSRKSEFDLTLYNQKPYEFMVRKLKYLTSQLQSFIELVGEIIGSEVKSKVKIELPEFEQNRIDNLIAITRTKVATAKQAEAIAEKNKAEAETLRNNIEKGIQTDITTPVAAQAIQESANGGE